MTDDAEDRTCMDIAVYGGSFNPPHLGHREAVITALDALNPDLLLIMPDHEPPHKEMEEGSPTPEQRLELCKMTFGDLDRVEVSSLELERNGKSYTYDTVLELQQRYPGARLTLIVGTDMILTFEEWYHFEYLLAHCRIAALARDLSDEAKLKAAAEHLRSAYDAEILLLDHAPLPMSSSELRGMLHRRLGAESIQDEAYALIIRHRFYDASPELRWLRERAYTMLDERRIAHVAGCESETKRLSHEEQLNLCEKYAIICDSAERVTPKLLHAKTGAAVARELFGVRDPVYEAIRWHTTGKPDMALLEKIIYLADYIEPSRDFPGVDALRELAYEDLDRALLLGLQMTIEEVRSHGEEPYIDTLTACAWYEERISERRD